MTDPKTPWKIVEHTNYMYADEEPIQIVDADENVVACNSPYYPTAISKEHAEIIVERVNAGGNKKIEVDIGQSIAMLKASPELGDRMMELIVGPQIAKAMEGADDLITVLAAALRNMVTLAAPFFTDRTQILAMKIAVDALNKVPADQPTEVK